MELGESDKLCLFLYEAISQIARPSTDSGLHMRLTEPDRDGLTPPKHQVFEHNYPKSSW